MTALLPPYTGARSAQRLTAAFYDYLRIVMDLGAGSKNNCALPLAPDLLTVAHVEDAKRRIVAADRYLDQMLEELEG